MRISLNDDGNFEIVCCREEFLTFHSMMFAGLMAKEQYQKQFGLTDMASHFFGLAQVMLGKIEPLVKTALDMFALGECMSCSDVYHEEHPRPYHCAAAYYKRHPEQRKEEQT